MHHRQGLSEYFIENEENDFIETREFFYNTFYQEIINQVDIYTLPNNNSEISFAIKFEKHIEHIDVSIDYYGAETIITNKNINDISINNDIIY